jgi:two-component system nitrogen regulation response regulator NtrX
MSRVLIIDDEPSIREILTEILKDEGYDVLDAEDGIKGLALCKTEVIDLILLDVWLPNMGGIDVLAELKKEYPEIEVVVISGHANIDMAVKAVKLGAFDFLEKPLSLEKVTTIIRNALQLRDLKTENKQLKNSITQNDRMIGETPQMEALKALIEQSAATDSRILITGENGTGKELVARAIHNKSRRSSARFLEVNCAAIPDTLIESELFGHQKGAFTTAVSNRKGKFELANRGSLFLDEVADMSLSAQAKVLRAIQEMKFERVGGEESISVDVRLITATNKDIQQEIKNGNFREDLYFRLNVIPIHVPALRERVDDIPLLAHYFLEKFSSGAEERSKDISDGGMKVLCEYPWPGNIRELKNFIERISIMSDERVVEADTVRNFLGKKKDEKQNGLLEEFEDMGLTQARDSFEKMYILQKLEEKEYNISRTAQELGIYPSNLHGKIKKFGIKIKK